MIRLNVGGRLFCTSETTLCRIPDSFFTGLLSGKFERVEMDDGAIFLDRSGTLFAVILEFMRSGHLCIPAGMSLQSVLREAQFYLLRDALLAALVPFASGLYVEEQRSGEHPSLVYVEVKHLPANYPEPVQIAITGVIDEQMVIRSLCHISDAGTITLTVGQATLHLLGTGKTGGQLTLWEKSSLSKGICLLWKEGPSAEFPASLPLGDSQRNVLSYKSEGESRSVWFSEHLEKGSIVMWELAGSLASPYTATALCSSLILLSGSTNPFAFIYLSGRVPFLFRPGGNLIHALRRLDRVDPVMPRVNPQ